MKNLNTIPTAEEFLKQKFTEIYNRRPLAMKEKLPLERYLELYVTGRIDGVEQNYPEMMIEFAKLHVEAVLKEASEKANLYLHNPGWKHSSDIKTVKCHNYDASINKDSILNSYPLTNIK